MKQFTDIRTNAITPINRQEIKEELLYDANKYKIANKIRELNNNVIDEKSVSKKLDLIARQNLWLAILNVITAQSEPAT